MKGTQRRQMRERIIRLEEEKEMAEKDAEYWRAIFFFVGVGLTVLFIGLWIFHKTSEPKEPQTFSGKLTDGVAVITNGNGYLFRSRFSGKTYVFGYKNFCENARTMYAIDAGVTLEGTSFIGKCEPVQLQLQEEVKRTPKLAEPQASETPNDEGKYFYQKLPNGQTMRYEIQIGVK